MSDVQQPPNNNPTDPTGSSGPTVRLEPVTESIIVPQPWYRRIFGPVTRTETVWKLSVVAILIVGVFIGQQMEFGGPQETRIQAAVGKARVSIYPLESRIPPEKSFQLWMTTDQPVTSATVQLTFDPKAIQLSREISPMTLAGAALTFTSWAKANETGILEFTVKSNSETVPVEPGTKQLGTFFFNTTKGTELTSANIMISEDNTVIVNQDKIPFALTTTNASVTLK